MSMLVIVPSRGRPENIVRLMDAWVATKADATLMVCVDDDDPQLQAYQDLGPCTVRPRLRMAGTLNAAAVEHAPFYTHLAFMGDDHLPRTEGWDRLLGNALDELGTGIAYGNDLIQGPNIPTAVFMTADIVRALGWMALPGARHLFLDNTWKTLGLKLDALCYMPDVIIEHLHPIAHQAEWDESYLLNNNHETWTHDEAVYNAWIADGLERDIRKIRAACG